MHAVRNFRPDQTAGIAEPLHRALTAMFASAKRPAASPYQKNLVERIQQKRIALCEHLATVVLSAVQRQVPQDRAEAFGHAYLAIVRREYGRARGEVRPSRREILERIITLARAETEAQGRADCEVQDVLVRPVNPEIAEAIQTSTAHARAQAELIEALADLAVCEEEAAPSGRIA